MRKLIWLFPLVFLSACGSDDKKIRHLYLLKPVL
ncbi:hypothetical protein JAMGFMIE_01963 [Rheinheimera sp. MM224]|nr:hypothetical protein JAMGFMIE_01963 [Rheinheimera sp. MM224]